MPQNLVLLINCPDQKGIVHAVTKFVFENGGNIIDSQQHSYGLDSRFFMRLCIDTSGGEGNIGALESKFSDIAKQYQMEASFHSERKKMAILVSKYDHCLYDILLRHQYGELDVDIPLIISNHNDLKHIGEMFKIPFHHLPINVSPDLSPEEQKAQRQNAKIEQEKEIIKMLKDHDVDFVVMARYMQILTSNIIGEYPYKIINVHHGFLPAFKGAKPYHQAYEKGVKIIGATSHYATEDLDMGPIIAQGVIEVGHRDDVEDYVAKGRDIEKMVFAKAIKAHAENKAIVHEGRTIVFE